MTTLRERCEKAARMELERQELTDYDVPRWADIIEREAKAFAEMVLLSELYPEDVHYRALLDVCVGTAEQDEK